MFITGPGHGAPAILANLFLEGSLSGFYPHITRDRVGAGYLIKAFSWPKLFPSHTYPGLPGSIHEGGELGYSLGTAFGAVFDKPELMALCVVGDGEAETGALATSWHSNKFYNPVTDGFVLPIVHINGYKISNPSIYGTMSQPELKSMFEGFGYEPIFVDQYELGDDQLIVSLDLALEKAYQMLISLRENFKIKPFTKPVLPVILLKTKKGWTGPKNNKEQKIEDNNYSHGIPIKNPKTDNQELLIIENWLKSYNPQNFFDNNGELKTELLQDLPDNQFKMGFNPYAQISNYQPLKLPNLQEIANCFALPGQTEDSELIHFGTYLNHILKNPANQGRFRIFSPDESESNLLEHVFETTKKVYNWPLRPWDNNFDPKGHMMEMLSEQTLQSWMQGYVLTGGHGVLISYEAFLSIIASQIDQYIKFIRQSQDFSWRKPVPSLNYIATSSVWRQDHNGFTHQNPILINTLLAKHVNFVHVYFPTGANTMLCTMQTVFSSSSNVNLIVAGKTKMPQWLSLEQAQKQVKDGIMTWDFASCQDEPDVVLRAIGDYQTQETLAGIDYLKTHLPELNIRFVNIAKLECNGFKKEILLANFTNDKQVIINFHGYPELIKQMLWGTVLEGRTTILGYIEKGTTTTPFDMQIKNLTSRYHVAILAIQKSGLKTKKALEVLAKLETKIVQHKAYIEEFGDDLKEVKNWKWNCTTDKKPKTADIVDYDNTNT
jgi:xylulose-5-phosphate/fructose-6-phosphate phosphoketolase